MAMFRIPMPLVLYIVAVMTSVGMLIICVVHLAQLMQPVMVQVQSVIVDMYLLAMDIAVTIQINIGLVAVVHLVHLVQHAMERIQQNALVVNI